MVPKFVLGCLLAALSFVLPSIVSPMECTLPSCVPAPLVKVIAVIALEIVCAACFRRWTILVLEVFVSRRSRND